MMGAAWVVPPVHTADARDDDQPIEDIEAALRGISGCEDAAYESLRTTAQQRLVELESGANHDDQDAT